jgi:hypothetical protein
MDDPRVWDEIVGYVRFEVASLEQLVVGAMGALSDSVRRLDDMRLEIAHRVGELEALQMRLRDASGGIDGYGEHVRAVLAARYDESLQARAHEAPTEEEA